ncbi:MAG: hypothetical protein KDK40_00280, partial [Chlamydiia bacterium]|nr:hypothetical protein [Chlamydiia bacterium]
SNAIRVTSEGSKGTTIKNENRIKYIPNKEDLKSSAFKVFRDLYVYCDLSAVESDRIQNLRIHLALLIEKKYKNTLDLKGEWHTGGAYMDIRDLFAAKLQLIQDESTLKSIQNKLDNFKNIINTLSTPEQNETPELTHQRNELIANTTTAFLISLLESLSKKDIPSALIPPIKLISSPL